jgi:hypothetical protein
MAVGTFGGQLAKYFASVSALAALFVFYQMVGRDSSAPLPENRRVESGPLEQEVQKLFPMKDRSKVTDRKRNSNGLPDAQDSLVVSIGSFLDVDRESSAVLSFEGVESRQVGDYLNPSANAMDRFSDTIPTNIGELLDPSEMPTIHQPDKAISLGEFIDVEGSSVTSEHHLSGSTELGHFIPVPDS